MMGHEIQVGERVRRQPATAKPALEPPRKYKVMLYNDDYTPMDFVVLLLGNFFQMSETQATKVMLEVHHQGRAICGTYTREIAETKVAQVNDYAQANEHPLLCVMDSD